MSKQAVVVVDMQNDYFASGKLPLVGIEDAARSAASVIAAARNNGVSVIHIRHEFPDADAPFLVRGSPGAQIHRSVRPISGEPVIRKQYANAFRNTALKQILDDEGVEAMVIVGAMSHKCIHATTRAALDLGYKTTVLHALWFFERQDPLLLRRIQANGCPNQSRRVPSASITWHRGVTATEGLMSCHTESCPRPHIESDATSRYLPADLTGLGLCFTPAREKTG
ncbi:hypothetical protein GCM10027093_73950 [Paraburkholderia jirisanensis]